jgi:hypothetical protein
LSAPQRFELSGRPILPAPCLRTVRSWPANPVGMNRDSQSCVPTFVHPLSLTPSLDATWSQWAHTSVSRCAFNRCGVMARFAPRASHWLILFIYRNRFSAHLSRACVGAAYFLHYVRARLVFRTGVGYVALFGRQRKLRATFAVI